MSVYLETGDIMPILACEPVRMWSSFTRCCINLKAAGYLLPSSARNLLLSTNNLLIAREKALSLFSTTASRIAQMLRSLLPFLEVTHNFTQNNNTPSNLHHSKKSFILTGIIIKKCNVSSITTIYDTRTGYFELNHQSIQPRETSQRGEEA